MSSAIEFLNLIREFIRKRENKKSLKFSLERRREFLKEVDIMYNKNHFQEDSVIKLIKKHYGENIFQQLIYKFIFLILV